MTMLEHLDIQDVDIDIYVVLNSSNPEFCMRLVDYCASMDKNVILIRLWSMATQIGLAFNCGLWHAMNAEIPYSSLVKIDDDVAILSYGVRELFWRCGDDKAVSVLLPSGKGYRYDDLISRRIRGSRAHDNATNEEYEFIWGACFMVPRGIHNDIGYFSEEAQRGMDLDFAVRVQRAGYSIVNHHSLRALHLGSTNATEGTKAARLNRKYCTFGLEQVRSTIWHDASVRHALIARTYGWKPRTQAQAPENTLDNVAIS